MSRGWLGRSGALLVAPPDPCLAADLASTEVFAFLTRWGIGRPAARSLSAPRVLPTRLSLVSLPDDEIRVAFCFAMAAAGAARARAVAAWAQSSCRCDHRSSTITSRLVRPIS